MLSIQVIRTLENKLTELLDDSIEITYINQYALNLYTVGIAYYGTNSKENKGSASFHCIFRGETVENFTLFSLTGSNFIKRLNF